MLPEDMQKEFLNLLEAVVFKDELQAYPYSTSALPPAVADLPNDTDWGFHVDSNTSKVYVAYNNGGSIKMIELP
jgi:hypothetical protein